MDSGVRLHFTKQPDITDEDNIRAEGARSMLAFPPEGDVRRGTDGIADCSVF